MRVLHIISGTGTGGAEGALHRLLIELRSRGAAQSVISLAPLGPMASVMRASGFEVRSAEFRSLMGIVKVLWRCTRWTRGFRPDVVQTWMHHADLIGGAAARLAGASRVVWGLRMSQMVGGMPLATRAVIRLCALVSRVIPRHIVAVAEASRPAHLALGYDLSRLTVISNGFELPPVTDETQRRAARAALGLPTSTEIVIGAIGRYDPFKDQPTLLKAFARLVTAGRPVHLALIGRGCESSNPQLTSLIASLNLQDRVTLAGERPQARALLPAFDVYCLSSRSEGFPNVVGEAMAAAVPCVVTDVGDAALLLGDTGIVVPPEDPVALAEGLQRLVDEASTARAVRGARARDRIAAAFTMSGTADQYFSLYTDLVAADRRLERH